MDFVKLKLLRVGYDKKMKLEILGDDVEAIINVNQIRFITRVTINRKKYCHFVIGSDVFYCDNEEAKKLYDKIGLSFD